ncbi:MAG: 50S ribosomal protein L16, partial [Nanoarchaeota archaeon]|nr:50S ribosomal protein L16 [Nanoarchaeota archaeon]
MASLRKASSYSKKYARPYTRKSAKRKRSYIKAVPANKLVKYNMGDKKAFNTGEHKFIVKLVAAEHAQMRDNSLESCRTTINKSMDKEAPGMYYFVIKVYPHHILRDNKTAAGAGADRLSSGMSHSFGTTMGRAALIKPGKDVFFLS